MVLTLNPQQGGMGCDMSLWKEPPREKVFEALTAVADERVKILAGGKADVVSSDGSRTYTVEWSEDERSMASNDNASYWQGYLGYPILAVLMARGRLAFDRDIARWLSKIEWHRLNQEFGRKYDKAVESVLVELTMKGIPGDVLNREVDRIMEQVKAMRIERAKSSARPPKS